jgi:hypothetical protein
MSHPLFSAAAIPKAWPFEEAATAARRPTASGRRDAVLETGNGSSKPIRGALDRREAAD